MSTPSRPQEQQHDQEEQEVWEEQEDQEVEEQEQQENVCLALTYSPPKSSQNQPTSQEVVCYPCTICENVFTSEADLSGHLKEHTAVAPPSSTEAGQLTASGRLIVLTPTFISRHTKFQQALNNDHMDEGDSSEDDESNDCQEACKVCKKTFTSVSDLQDHIIGKHSSQSESVLELLKLQQKLLNSLLAGQVTQLERVDAIAFKQSSLSEDIKEIKEKSSSFPFSPSPPPYHPPRLL